MILLHNFPKYVYKESIIFLRGLVLANLCFLKNRYNSHCFIQVHRKKVNVYIEKDK